MRLFFLRFMTLQRVELMQIKRQFQLHPLCRIAKIRLSDFLYAFQAVRHGVVIDIQLLCHPALVAQVPEKAVQSIQQFAMMGRVWIEQPL